MKDLKPLGQVAQVLSQVLTPVSTTPPQLVSEKVSTTKADEVVVRPIMRARVEVIERCILESREIVCRTVFASDL